MRKNERGITLIALVVTIVVLIILAGVSISMLTGENGIVTQAQEARNETEKEEEKEKVKLAVTSSKLKDVNNMMINKDDLQYELKQQFDDNFELTDNKDNSFLITIKDSKREYYVNEDGKVIDDILKITTEEELKRFREEVNNGNTFNDKAILLMNDITLNENWIPIGYVSDENVVEFNGDFNGLNHNINNLNINSADKSYQGLFSKTGSLARINGVTITGSINGAKYVGAVVGYNQGNIRNCGNEANVMSEYDLESNPCTGGIAGYNYNGNFNGCYNKGEVSTARYSSGGIVGKSEGGIIKNCYNTAKIIAGVGEAAGICGTANNTSFKNVYNIGDITVVTRSGSGGIVGIAINNSNIINAYNIGKIQGIGNTAGIVGSFEKGTVQYCYNKANIICNETTGGIIGELNSIQNVMINNCYHYGSIETPSDKRGPITGNIEHEYIVQIQNCEWYTDNQEYYNSVIGKTGIKFNENIDMKNVLEVVNGDNFFVSNNDDNHPKLYWE